MCWLRLGRVGRAGLTVGRAPYAAAGRFWWIRLAIERLTTRSRDHSGLIKVSLGHDHRPPGAPAGISRSIRRWLYIWLVVHHGRELGHSRFRSPRPGRA